MLRNGVVYPSFGGRLNHIFGDYEIFFTKGLLIDGQMYMIVHTSLQHHRTNQSTQKKLNFGSNLNFSSNLNIVHKRAID